MITDIVDEITGEVRKFAENASEVRSASVDLMSRIEPLESLVITIDERFNVEASKLSSMSETEASKEKELEKL